jgi:hypothetical protein
MECDEIRKRYTRFQDYLPFETYKEFEHQLIKYIQSLNMECGVLAIKEKVACLTKFIDKYISKDKLLDVKEIGVLFRIKIGASYVTKLRKLGCEVYENGHYYYITADTKEAIQNSENTIAKLSDLFIELSLDDKLIEKCKVYLFKHSRNILLTPTEILLPIQAGEMRSLYYDLVNELLIKNQIIDYIKKSRQQVEDLIDIERFISLFDLEPKKSIELKIIQLISSGTLSGEKCGGKWYLTKSAVEVVDNFRLNFCSIRMLLECVTQNYAQIDKIMKQNIFSKLKEDNNNIMILFENYSFFGDVYFVKKNDEAAMRCLIKEKIEEEIEITNGISIEYAAIRLDIPVTVIRLYIDKGDIVTIKKGGRKVIPSLELQSLEKNKKKYVGINTIVSEIVNKVGSKFELERFEDRSNLFKYMEMEDYFGCDYLEAEDVNFDQRSSHMFWFKRDDSHLIGEIERYLINYQLTSKEKIIKLKEKIGRHNARNTLQFLCNYFEGRRAYSQNVTANYSNLLAFLLEHLHKELTLYSTEEMNTLKEQMGRELPYSSFVEICSFWKLFRKKHDCISKLKFTYNSLQKEKIMPYEMTEYFNIAYMVFNKNSINNEGLIHKAVQSKMMANVWLFIAMHFVCGWRRSDISRLPHIELGMEPEEILHAINREDFTEEKAMEYVGQIELIVEAIDDLPGKTMDKNARPLIMEVATSIRPIFGIILAINEAHFQILYGKEARGRILEPENIEKRHYDNFYGENFNIILSGENFKSRRANKSFLQGISMETEKNEVIKCKGMVIAAMARGHKDTQNGFSDSTQIYLEGYNVISTSKYLLSEMIERGFLSFTLYQLLSVLNDDYKKMDYHSQTEIIKKLDIHPYDLEKSIELNKTLLIRTEKTIKNLFSEECLNDKELLRQRILKMLSNMDSAKGKIKGEYCLKLACGDKCQSPRRLSCTGCEYEILSRTAMFYLKNEMDKFKGLYNSAKTDGSKRKYKTILNEILYPEIYGVLHVLKEIYKVDIKKYKGYIRGAI